MILTIPDEFIDTTDRTDAMVKASSMFGYKRSIDKRTFKDAMEAAVRYGCRDYKRKDWQRLAFVSTECLTITVQQMNIEHDLGLTATDIYNVVLAVRLAAGRYLAYS